MAATYRVVMRKDESGTWIVHVPSVAGCHTYGRSIRQAKTREREALSLFVDAADAAHLEWDVRVPSRLRTTVTGARRARARADSAQEAANEAVAVAVSHLADAGYSRRDAADLLGVSHQRIQQLLEP